MKLTILDDEKWNAIKENAFYKEMVDEVIYEANLLKKIEVKSIEKDVFDEYYVTGNRLHYEEKYFSKRKRLCVFTLSYLITSNKEYLYLLERVIQNICDEFTWALPAHTQREDTIEKRHTLDLFACETGYYLSEIGKILEKDFDEETKNIISENVRERIIHSFIYENKDLWWEHKSMNWTAVCSCGILHAFIYEGSEKEFDTVKSRLLNCADIFLDSFSKDGACLEGYGYYMYGFTFFVQMAQTLYEFTDGGINLFEDERVRKISLFSSKIRMGEGKFYPFSDAVTEDFTFDMGLNSLLHQKYTELELFDKKYRTTINSDSCYRFSTIIRNFMWASEHFSIEQKYMKRDVYYADAGICIKNKRNYSFAIKAGHNDEPHNHNDVGSIALCVQDEFILCDIGAMEYTKQYFEDKNRYNFVAASSRGHSVPMIDQEYQKPGSSYYGDLFVTEDGVNVTYHTAYDLSDLNELYRKVAFGENDIVVEDYACFASCGKHKFTDRFVSKIEPNLDGDCVSIHNVRICCENENVKLAVSSEIYNDHEGKESKLFFIDFICCDQSINAIVLKVAIHIDR